MDSVFIEGLRFSGKHGVHEHERKSEQEFLIDIRAELDLRKASESDNLPDTANYSNFATIAREAVERNSFYLIERLAGAIARRILEDERVREVTVTIRKPAALEGGVPGITIMRSQS